MVKTLTAPRGVRLLFPLLGVVIGLFYTGRQASALPEFREAARKVYAFKPGGVIDKAQCNLCHTDVPKLNPYGQSIKGILPKPRPKTLSAELLHSLDSADADGDGFTNGEEFKADTLPGDPTSHPAGNPTTPAASASVAPNRGEANSGAPSAASGEISPFDIKTALLAKNAQHPALIHFPIALFIVSMLFDLLAIWRKNPTLGAAAYFNLCLAALSSLVAVATGLIAWQWKYGGAALEGNLRLHLIFGSTSAVLMCALWGIRFQRQKQGKQDVGLDYLILGLIAMALVALTGHIGGIVS